MSHGGRRHGLAPAGPAPRVAIRLGPEDRARLEVLQAAWSEGYGRALSLAETARMAIEEAHREHERAQSEPALTDEEVAELRARCGASDMRHANSER